MTTVVLPYFVQDQLTALAKGMRATESFHYEDDGREHFLDGPVSRRVAVLDFDESTGALLPPVRYEPPGARRKRGRYGLREPYDAADRDFQRVSVFSTVMKTIRMFEAPDVLGRELQWAFDAPQLLVVPRAGEWANAFYERESRSLQFFHFEPPSCPGTRVYTSLSHDIVAHEAGHAAVDAIAPDLYDAVTPQALALHEAMADLTALVTSLESGTLRRTVLDQMKGRIDAHTAVSAVAEELGSALGEGRSYLRSLWNAKTLDPANTTYDDHEQPNRVSRASPHELSEVLSGALYKVLAGLHVEKKRELTRDIMEPAERERAEFRMSGKALFIATQVFRRLVFRALDYLPPGEISFADFGRAVIAADRSANAGSPGLRRALARELVARHVASSIEALEAPEPLEGVTLEDVDLDALLDSDWAAYEFAGRNRELLRLPRGVPFRVLPRLAVEKTTWRMGRQHRFREFIFKVSWEHQEDTGLGWSLPPRRAIRVGTTLVVDRDTRQIRTRLTTDRSKSQRKDRTQLLHEILDEDLLTLGHDPQGGTAVLQGEVSRGVLRIRGGARSLHLATAGG